MQIFTLTRYIARRKWNEHVERASLQGVQLQHWDEIQGGADAEEPPEDSELNESRDKAIGEHLDMILALKRAEKAS
jgi:hypothetical protein